MKTQSPLPHPRYRTKFRRESFPSDLHVAALPAASRPRARCPIPALQIRSAAPPATRPPVCAPPTSYLSPPLVPPSLPPLPAFLPLVLTVSTLSSSLCSLCSSFCVLCVKSFLPRPALQSAPLVLAASNTAATHPPDRAIRSQKSRRPISRPRVLLQTPPARWESRESAPHIRPQSPPIALP